MKSNDLTSNTLVTCENKSKKPLLISALNSKIVEPKLSLNKRSISTKNLKQGLSSPISMIVLPTYKIDGMKIIANRINAKIRSYFEAIVGYADKVKRSDRENSCK